MQFEISPITTEKEMDEKGYVHWKSWQETYGGLMPDGFLQNITLDKCVTMAHKWTQNTLVLKIDGVVAGFSCFGEYGDAAKEIVALYLLKEHHGKKLGYSLLNATFDELPSKTKVYLWVLKGNDRAINFYKRCGFAFTGEEKTAPFGVELEMMTEKE